MALLRPYCGVTAGKISLSDAGALGEQSRYDFDIPAIGGHHQRCHAVLVLRIDRGADIEEEAHRLDLIAIGREVQRSVAELSLASSLALALISIAMIVRLPFIAA